jgi:hypothetical protein
MSEDIDDANPNKNYSILKSPDNNEQAVNFTLFPFDVINIRKMAVYEKPETVIISGAV